jgi:hypothetical protein
VASRRLHAVKTARAVKQAVEDLPSTAVAGGHEMGVDAQGERWVAVPEILGHHLDALPRGAHRP